MDEVPDPYPALDAPGRMLAMVLRAGSHRLQATQLPIPAPGPHEVVLRVSACGVCRTDLHLLDGELTPHRPQVVPGHEVVGRVVATGELAGRFIVGQRVGIPWLAGACHLCEFCRHGQENLCAHARFTGYDRDGGYAQYTAADERYCFALPDNYDDVHAAPLLCAGLIGYRAWAMANEVKGVSRRIGLYGFGAAAHVIAQVAVQQGKEVFAFTRSGDLRSQEFARRLGAAWAGGSEEAPPAPLDAAILFAPAGPLVPAALKAVRKGGTVVCAGIHMSDIPSFSYDLLWGERMLRSVANLTREDAERFLALVARLPVHTRPVTWPLEQANEALAALRQGDFDGAAVLLPRQRWA